MHQVGNFPASILGYLPHLEIFQRFLASFFPAFKCPNKEAEIPYQCATRFKKTTEGLVRLIVLLGYHLIHILFLQYKFSILNVIIVFEIDFLQNLKSKLNNDMMITIQEWTYQWRIRSSHSEVFLQKGVLEKV